MIIFYRKTVDEVVLASIVKHYNPSAILREYSDNQDVIGIAKIHNEANFIRVKDFKEAIKKNYRTPDWIQNRNLTLFVKKALSHRLTDSFDVVSHLAEYLYHPEKLFYSSIDKAVILQQRVKEISRELSMQKRLMRKEYREGILFIDARSEHEILDLLLDDLKTCYEEPFVLLCNDKAAVANAALLGFDKDTVRMTRFDAYKLRKPAVIVKLAQAKNRIPAGIVTHLCEF